MQRIGTLMSEFDARVNRVQVAYEGFLVLLSMCPNRHRGNTFFDVTVTGQWSSSSAWAFSIYKKIRKISIGNSGNFRLGRERSICHKSHSFTSPSPSLHQMTW